MASIIHSSLVQAQAHGCHSSNTSIIVTCHSRSMLVGTSDGQLHSFDDSGLESTPDFIARMIKEAKERQGVFDIAQEGKGKDKDIAGEGKLLVKSEGQPRVDKDDLKKRKHGSDIKVCERYNEDDANISIISSNGISFKVHSFILLRAS